eukprot:627407-Amphidinium_carterae.1
MMSHPEWHSRGDSLCQGGSTDSPAAATSQVGCKYPLTPTYKAERMLFASQEGGAEVPEPLGYPISRDPTIAHVQPMICTVITRVRLVQEAQSYK